MPQRGVSHYRPLLDYLLNCTESEVVLNIGAVEAILGFALPARAQVGSWWADLGRSHVALWWGGGWRAHLDHRNQRVIFTRDEEGVR